jgi:hypothetical protein
LSATSGNGTRGVATPPGLGCVAGTTATSDGLSGSGQRLVGHVGHRQHVRALEDLAHGSAQSAQTVGVRDPARDRLAQIGQRPQRHVLDVEVDLDCP